MVERTFHYCKEHQQKFWDVDYCPRCDEEARAKRAAAYAAMPRYRYPGLAYIEPFPEHTAESDWPSCLCQTCQEKRFTMEQLPGAKIDWAHYRKATR